MDVERHMPRMKKLIRACAVMGAFGLINATLWADDVPASVLNSNGLATNVSVNVLGWGPNPAYPVSFSFGIGGGFAATVDNYRTTVWCVDAQEDIFLPTTYSADLVSTTAVTANSNYVHYGNVTPSGWQMDLGAAYASAQTRFQMAAYLVGQYSNFPNGPAPNDLQNQEIQTAIWEIMWNGGTGAPDGLTYSQIQAGPGTSTAVQNAVAGYISDAQNFVSNPLNAGYFNNFAIVSGNVDPSGNLTSPGYQTFLIQVPEPSTWFLLLAGLGLVALNRRRTYAKSL